MPSRSCSGRSKGAYHCRASRKKTPFMGRPRFWLPLPSWSKSLGPSTRSPSPPCCRRRLTATSTAPIISIPFSSPSPQQAFLWRSPKQCRRPTPWDVRIRNPGSSGWRSAHSWSWVFSASSACRCSASLSLPISLKTPKPSTVCWLWLRPYCAPAAALLSAAMPKGI